MKEIDDNLLTEFLEGKLDDPTNREIENWYDASEENRRRLETLYFVLFAGDRLRAAASVNTDQAFRSLQRRIELRRTKTRPQWRQIVSRYAAILVAGVIVAILTNVFLIFPAYMALYGMDWAAIVQMCTAVNPWITNVPTMVAFSIVPFNVISFGVTSILAMLLYKKISVPLKKFAMIG